MMPGNDVCDDFDYADLDKIYFVKSNGYIDELLICIRVRGIGQTA
ncbi:Uncharacterised protein [Neisseria animalis]|nr:Uncharacterised protein [Neisseria animalis]